MTKANSIKKAAISIVLIGQALLPAASYAAVPREPSAPVSDPGTIDTFEDTDGSAGFCNRVGELVPRITGRLNEREANLEAKRAELRAGRNAVRAAAAGKLAELRAKEDGVRSGITIKLDARAQTSAQKAAVARFKTAMDAAIAARRTAMGAARTAFHEGLDALIAARVGTQDNVLAAYTLAVKTALNKAKADCVGRIRETIVRERLRTALQAAHQQFVDARAQLQPQSAAVQALIEARRTATQRAHDEFKTKAEAARTALKEAFGASGGIR